MGETKERNRLAREIHDTLGHTLTGLSVGLEACQVMIDRDVNVTKAQLGILQESAKRGLTDVRRSVDKLKPDALERYSLKEALDMMIMDFQKLTDVTILYLCHLPLVNLNADEEEIVYRVVQEGMTNSVRHGHATKIYVSIAQADNNLIIIIEDNGQGCKDVNPGFGIHHLTERINLLQGRIRYYGDNGFELIVEIPMRRGENNG
jgi:signal transduction histidine kinase